VAAGISSAGDLGYTYGTCDFHPVGTPQDSIASAAYLRIWRQGSAGGHEIVLDLESPMPPAAKAKR
jgi:hypothetical protein